MAQVILKDVTKRFDRTEVVSNFGLHIKDKEFLILVGPSGCGKSTTLRMVAGLETVTKGEIYIGDRLVNNMPPKDRNLAMVFQNYALYPHKSVYQNMAFGLKMRKHPKSVIEERVRKQAKILEIEDFLDRRPEELSGGQRQRVALGRAIVREPDVFLLDEPLSNLDAKLRVHMRMELIRLHKRLETTMIYVTHDQVEAMTMGDRIVVMKDGLIHQEGTSLELFNQPRNLFVAGFIGSPTMNFIDCEIIRKNSSLYAMSKGMMLKIPPEKARAYDKYDKRNLVLGIRPQHFYSTDLFPGKIEGNTFKVVAEVIETLGSEIIIYLDVEGQIIVGNMSADTEVSPGQKFEIAVDMSKIHLFDPDSEEAIY